MAFLKNGWTLPLFSWSFTDFHGWCRIIKFLMSPEMINFFLYCKKMSFSCSPKGTPHDRCRRTMKKNTLPWKPLELGGVSQKDDESSPWDLYSMYVVLQGIESLTCTRVYTKFPLGSSNLDVWSSWTGTFIKQQVTRNDQSLFVLYSKTWVFQGHLRVPPGPVSQNYQNKLLCNENQWN